MGNKRFDPEQKRFETGAMLTQGPMCRVIGITPRTLARYFADFVRTGDDSRIPPFLIERNQRRWRYDYVIAFKEKKTSLRGKLDSYPPFKEESDSVAELPNIEAVLHRIAEWKARERWKRANNILTRQSFTKSGELRFKECTWLYNPEWSDPTEQEVASFIARHELETKAVILEIGLPWIEQFDQTNSGRVEYRTMLGAKNVIGAALRSMFADEKRWRARAEWGDYEDDMPLTPPA
jgi:hypothetical protein